MSSSGPEERPKRINKPVEVPVELVPAAKLTLFDSRRRTAPNEENQGEASVGDQTAQKVVRLQAPQPLHVRPAATLNDIRKFFFERNPANELEIPLALDGEGNAIGASGWQPLEPMNTLTRLEIIEGAHIDLRFSGPDAADMEALVRVAFSDNFHRKARKRRAKDLPGYIECYEAYQKGQRDEWFDGAFNQARSGTRNAPELVSDMKAGSNLLENTNVAGDLILVGPGPRSGFAVAGIARHVDLRDFGKNYALGSAKMVDLEVGRLASLEKLLLAGSQHDVSAVLVEGHDRTKATHTGTGLWTDIQVEESRWLVDAIGMARGIARNEIDPATLARKSIAVDVVHGPYPNAELALELAIDPMSYSEANRDKYQGIKLTAMQYLLHGLDSSRALAYVMKQITERSPTPFARCGIYLLQNGPEGNYLESSLEWKDGHVRDITAVDKRALTDRGIGVVEAYRRCRDGSDDCLLITDASTNPLTSKGYIESESVVFKTIPGGLGVIWADNMDQRPIIPESLDHLDSVALSMAYIIRLNREIEGYRMSRGDHEIAILNRDPTGSEVINLMDHGYIGAASPDGKENCHYVIIMGGNRFPAVVGLGQELRKQIPDGSRVLIADTADSQDAFIIKNPERKTMYFFGLAPGEQKSIEPDMGEISDAVTTDGQRIHLRGALMGSKRDHMDRFIRYCPEGVGFMRLEMIMINDPPNFRLLPGDSEGHLEGYISDISLRVGTVLNKHAQRYNGEPVIGRLLDVTSDKLPDMIRDAYGPEAAKTHTGLSFLCHHWDDLMVPSVRGYCRANASLPQPFGIMMPNVQNVKDAIKTIDFIRRTNDEITEDKPILIYAQMESHHAIRNVMESIAPYVDGFAIGFNDLTESVTGMKRSAGGYPEFSLAVWEDVEYAQIIAGRFNKPLTSCGGLGERPPGVAALVGLGITSISMPSRFIPEIRVDINILSREECARWVHQIKSGLPPSGSSPEEATYLFLRRRIMQKRAEEEFRRRQ